MRRLVDQAHHVGNHHRALFGDHEGNVGVVLVAGAIGVEVVIEQDRDFTGQHARICGLLGHDRLVLLQVLEILEGRAEVVERAAHGLVDRDCAHVADEGAGGVEIADQALVLGLEQVGP
ncbi:hypothetical protein D9M72_403200 [compost metagenome]